MADNTLLHEVVITTIIVKAGKYLITRRSKNKKRFPGMWTVPGGHLETNDYINLPKEAKNYELIDGIYDELAMAEQKRQGKKVEWKR